MAFEDIKAEVDLLAAQMNDEAQDRRELYQQLHLKLGELKAFGLSLPADLVELEKWLEDELGDAELGGGEDEE
jgi:hypothetical protein